MFGTTKYFLDYFGLKKLEDLPPLADLSDLESLRVQLNLPDVEEDTSDENPTIPELPVLYSEIEIESESEGTVEEDDESDTGAANLIVSERSDPAESGG